MNKIKVGYLRNFIFGVEDSLVSTIGLVSGIAVAGVAVETLLLTGVILIFVEAFSMGVGSLLSENTADEYVSKKEISLVADLGYAIVMFLSYLLSGFLILLPYLFLSGRAAIIVSIIAASLALFILGSWSGKVSKINWLRRGFYMAIIGGVTIILGIAVGQIMKLYV